MSSGNVSQAGESTSTRSQRAQPTAVRAGRGGASKRANMRMPPYISEPVTARVPTRGNSGFYCKSQTLHGPKIKCYKAPSPWSLSSPWSCPICSNLTRLHAPTTAHAPRARAQNSHGHVSIVNITGGSAPLSILSIPSGEGSNGTQASSS